MTADNVQPSRYDLFEVAKEAYALHSAIFQLAHIPNRKEYRQKLIERLRFSIEKFAACGGIIETKEDIFSEKRPVLSYPDPKEIIPYSIGKMYCEQLLSS